MDVINGKENKRNLLRDIILKMHQGLSIEQAKERFEKEIGSISSTEIAEIEQSLINEGISPDIIKKFCNVHALLFKSALEATPSKEESPTHPIYLFKMENREIEKITSAIKTVVKDKDRSDITQAKQEIKDLLTQLKGLDTHYVRKEHLLFPFLEKYGFLGPSTVMWGKDNDIRNMLSKTSSEMDIVDSGATLDGFTTKYLNPLIDEVEGMIFKEERILFPTSLEKLNIDDWVQILTESEGIGYVFIEKPKETQSLISALRSAVVEEPTVKDKIVSFPSGNLSLDELMAVLNTLPLDVTFVDKDDKVRYFSEGKNRIFIRPRSVIGRTVQNCHPPQSVDVVEKILRSFKEGKKESAEFWINFKDKLVNIRYFAVRGSEGEYLGTLEVTQDITDIKKLEGERRLLDEGN